MRNAILGDTFGRLVRCAGRQVDVQNYIDNTGVQVADVVVGFLPTLARKNPVLKSSSSPKGHASTTTVGISTPAPRSGTRKTKPNLQVRLQTLHEIEAGGNETSLVADLIAVAVLRRHLETMDRLDIEYDFLPRESEILSLHFWDAAFIKLKEAGVLTFEMEGKNKGCWVMRRAGVARAPSPANVDDSSDLDDPLRTVPPIGADVRPEPSYEPISEDDQKVIVRSNGTVGYVGKDIAYHMWKFGLLGRDFGYRKFYRYPNSHDCWISTADGGSDHPHFGDVVGSNNVIVPASPRPRIR